MPQLDIPRKLHRILNTKARLIVIIGGRGSAKSESIARILLMEAQTQGIDVLCGREFQNSIEDSVHKLLTSLISTLEVQGANYTDTKIDFDNGGSFRFKGFSRNSQAVKSAQGFGRSWIEEAQDLSAKSISDLLPTIRANNSRLYFTANPQSSADPFSKRFITPFKAHLDREGFYEDAMHLIIVINWRDNPWHCELEPQRVWDKENLSTAEYDHIWEGAFNDSIENAIITAEQFDACVDAHLKLGFEPSGAILAAHDPSDKGRDPKGFAIRQGSVFLDVLQNQEGDVNEGMDWALDLAIRAQADYFVWDCDGMGISLKRQVSDSLLGKKMEMVVFKGSNSPENPEEDYISSKNENAGNIFDIRKSNKDTFANKRAQNYIRLRDRIYNTFVAVTKDRYTDPETMISFSSNIKDLAQLRSEISRIPLKPNGNGKIQIMTKIEMAKKPYSIPSPNMSDSCMMDMHIPGYFGSDISVIKFAGWN